MKNENQVPIAALSVQSSRYDAKARSFVRGSIREWTARDFCPSEGPVVDCLIDGGPTKEGGRLSKRVCYKSGPFNFFLQPFFGRGLGKSSAQQQLYMALHGGGRMINRCGVRPQKLLHVCCFPLSVCVCARPARRRRLTDERLSGPPN